LSIFVSLLAEPLSKTQRSDTDHLTIELVLHLFRNLLNADFILKASTETSQKSAQLHHELICLFEKELVLEILLVIAQDMESRENAQYNLLLMELLNHLLRNQDPTAVARSSSGQPASTSKSKMFESLTAQLQREKLKVRPSTTSRHSHFGGTLVVNRLDGKRQYMSAALVEKGASRPAAQKRKNRKTDPFIGSGRTFVQEGPAATRSQRTLNTFCGRFVKDCYGPLMKSLKNEFRRDSLRLEEGDKVVFFRMIWFFCQWWRVSGKNTALGQLIFTMDVFTFNLVLNTIDFFQQHKKYAQLAQSVSLYSEMMQLLHVMYQSKDSTEHVMALGLLDRLFYGSDPLDRLPKLLSKWAAGTSTREYVSNLVELTHVTLKLLEASTQGTPIEKATNDAVTRMKQNAADFDLTSYIVRKIISNQVVFMFTHLLSQYSVNPPHVNHHIVAFFLRFSRVLVVSEDDNDNRGDFPQNPLAIKPATLGPMLYNIQLFVVLDQILNDATIRKEKGYYSLIAFSTSVMSRFASHVQMNQMAFVEILFRHPVPHRFCELSANMYVNEELRMIAERELLLDEHRREAASEVIDEDEVIMEQYRRPSNQHSVREESPPALNVAEDDEEEVEWNDGDKEESEGPTSPQPDASEKSEDDPKEDVNDDERWSDRRAFVPKRKHLSDIDANVLVDKKQRIQKPVRDDSSGDAEEFEFDTAHTDAPADEVVKPTRLVIEDDEE
jgi:timeless